MCERARARASFARAARAVVAHPRRSMHGSDRAVELAKVAWTPRLRLWLSAVSESGRTAATFARGSATPSDGSSGGGLGEPGLERGLSEMVTSKLGRSLGGEADSSAAAGSSSLNASKSAGSGSSAGAGGASFA